ncbi:GPI-anchored CFEM domain protein [Colletotrichum siamense]|nr:GPI-anchored CFEM domain protein [Colletotrichum siamense]KAF4867852.1 GPI-anchored CFEM domain protein [Colletotrichum siamense]
MRRRIWLQATASVVLLGAAHAQLDSLPPCGISCVNTVIAKGFGCASQDNSCLCKQQDFVFGVRDCASQSCGADVATKVNDYVTSLCATATQAPPASTQPPASQPASSPPPQPTTPAPAQASSEPAQPAATVATNGAEKPSSQPVNSAPADATSKAISEDAQTTQVSTPAPTTMSTSTKSTTKSTTSTSTGSQGSQSGSASESDSGKLSNDTAGLSVPAKIGIGVGAGVGVLAIALALYLLVRRPQNRTRSMQISGPMPGSGRDYGIVGMTGKNYSELEMRSRRYEDMVPRQSPRRMI